MKRFLILLMLAGCSLKLPQSLSPDLTSPINIQSNGKNVVLYIEREQNAYSILGIHPLSGREFLIKVVKGRVVKEEYGYLFTRQEVREIIKQNLLK